jgi:hypothetical protein
MNLSVLLFFLHNVLATFFLGVKFKGRKDRVFKFFGIALLLDAAAFAAWTFGVIRPENLLICVTLGALCFLASLVFLLHTSLQKVQATTRLSLTVIGIAAVLGIFYVGHIDPSTAYISPEGFFFFNLPPLVQMLYIFALTLAALPAIDLVASKFQSSYAALIRYGFIAEVVAGIMLITSKDSQVLYITGWVVAVVYVALWSTLLFSKKAWSNVD